MKNLGAMMKQVQEMQTRMQEMQARLETMEIEGRAGGGLVNVVLSGKGALKTLKIDASLMKPEEREILEDLIVAAHGEARARMEDKVAAEMKDVTGGLPLPPGFQLPM
jgi:DNA-binding YbaB/EbfC family protein